MTGNVVRVASVPAGHPYVRHIADVSRADDVVRLPDPTDPWWPPTMLDPRWVRDHAAAFDLMHVHFGFDGVAPETLDELGRELTRQQRPLVVTVHDLRNPHHPSRDLHDQQLGALLTNATRVVTLTAHSARAIGERHRIDVEVIPHPHIVDLEEMRRRQSAPRPQRSTVGIHLKSLRPNMETAVVDAAVDAVGQVAGSELRVDVHRDVAEPDGARHDPALMERLHRYAGQGALRLVTHDFFDEDAFVDYLDSLKASVLPYRFGTHSGWLEACRDLGVAVVAPDCGSYHDQGPVFGFGCNEEAGFNPASCTAAVVDALRAPAPEPVPWQERLDQRRAIAEAHRRVYRDALRSVGH
jgi:hypothetical protein